MVMFWRAVRRLGGPNGVLRGAELFKEVDSFLQHHGCYAKTLPSCGIPSFGVESWLQSLWDGPWPNWLLSL